MLSSHLYIPSISTPIRVSVFGCVNPVLSRSQHITYMYWCFLLHYPLLCLPYKVEKFIALPLDMMHTVNMTLY